jgi:cytochrome c-type biogenesis protein CcmH
VLKTQLAGFFSTLSDVVARLDQDGQAGDIEDCYARNPTLPGGRDFEIRLDTVH